MKFGHFGSVLLPLFCCIVGAPKCVVATAPDLLEISASTNESESDDLTPSITVKLRGGGSISAEEVVAKVAAPATDLSSKPLGELALQEKAGTTEDLYKTLEGALSLLADIDLSQAPQIEKLIEQFLDHSKQGKKAASEAIKLIRQAANQTQANRPLETLGASQKAENSRCNTLEKNNITFPSQEEHRRLIDEGLKEFMSQRKDQGPELIKKTRKKLGIIGRGGSHSNFGPHSPLRQNLHQKIADLTNAIQNGDHNTVRAHIQSFQQAHAARFSHNTQEGSPGQRKLTKAEMCYTLKGCASKMSMYDLFCYYKSDDIDDTTGAVDDNLVVFDEDDLKTKYDYIQGLVSRTHLSDAQCNDLLSQFHRTIEYEDVPEWEGASVSQVCLAEGTTMFVELGQAAGASLQRPAAVPNFDQNLWKQVPGGLVGISGGTDGSVWGYSSDHKFWSRNFDQWKTHPSLPWGRHFKWLDVGNRHHIWAVDTHEKMWQFKIYHNRDQWHARHDGEAWWVAAGDDGEVWHVGNNRWVYRRNSDGGWYEPTDHARADMLSIANRDNIWGVDRSRAAVMQFTWSESDHAKGTWEDIPAVEVTTSGEVSFWPWFVSVAGDGSVWLLDTLGKVYRRNHDTDRWEQPSPEARLATVAALGTSHAWGTSSDTNIWHYEGVQSLDYFKKLADRFQVLVETFAEEPIKCAEELFFSSARVNDPQRRWASETFVFSVDGGKLRDRSRLSIPTGLSSSTTVRTPHGQLQGNAKQAFTFTKYTDLKQKYTLCVEEQRSVVDARLPQVFLDNSVSSQANFLALTDEFRVNMTKNCIQKLFKPIQKGLELVFGERPSPGFICGVKDAVVSGRKTMPGTCCLDAPFQLDGDKWGNPYTCDGTCKTWGPFLAGSSVQACEAQGGTWCPESGSECKALKECIAEEITWANTTTPKRPAFLEYLDGAPKIPDTTNFEHCAKTREYFGVTANFINDQQVCEDIHQLRFSSDFAFLDEFWNQGEDEISDEDLAGDDLNLPDIPPMELTEPDLETLELDQIKNGQKWRGVNFALEKAANVAMFIYKNFAEYDCPFDWTCPVMKMIVAPILHRIADTLKQMADISWHTYGEVAEVGNIEPIETNLRAQAVYDHIRETGVYLQERFAAFNVGLEAVHDKLNPKLDEILDGMTGSHPTTPSSTPQPTPQPTDPSMTPLLDSECPRPQYNGGFQWCDHEGSSYSFRDCDGDGLREHFCIDTAGHVGIISPSDGCTDNWPNGDPHSCECLRPQHDGGFQWCGHEGSKYDVRDCDGDGLLEHICYDNGGNVGIISLKNGCASTWPDNNRGYCECPRPEYNGGSLWCEHEGSRHAFQDCNGDGLREHICTDSAGNVGILSSSNSCTSTWPNDDLSFCDISTLKNLRCPHPGGDGVYVDPGQVLEVAPLDSSGTTIFHNGNPPGVYTYTKQYLLAMQSDGNLVLYRVRDQVAVWASQTHGNPHSYATFQGDGNLVVYNARNQPIYASHTSNNPTAMLYLGESGILGVFDLYTCSMVKVLRDAPSRNLLANSTFRDPPVYAAPLTVQVEIVSQSPKRFLVFTTVDGGMGVEPAVLGVSAFDSVSSHFFNVTDATVTEVGTGTKLVSLPAFVTSKHVQVTVASAHGKAGKRMALLEFDIVSD